MFPLLFAVVFLVLGIYPLFRFLDLWTARRYGRLEVVETHRE